jgi:hypothetical protein
MKKILIPTLGLLLAVATTQAQTDYTLVKNDIKKEKRAEKKEVSYQSKQQFFVDFGDIPNVAWERSSYFDEANFTQDGQEKTAFYDLQSQLVGTTISKTFADLPMAAQQYIHEKYKGYEAKDVFMFDDNEFNESDMLLFGQQFEDADSYFLEVQKDNKKIVLQVSMDGEVNYFTAMK